MFKRLIGLALFFTLVSSPGAFAQEVPGVDYEEKQTGLEFDVVVAPVGLPLDGGEMSFIATQPLAGVTYPVNVLGLDFAPGVYGFGSMAAKNGDAPNWSLGVVAGVKIPALYDTVLGLAYTFLQEGDGGLPFKTENLAITIGITL